MGAIVGSLYSCGWTPDSTLRFFESPDFGYWMTGTINPADKYYFDMPEKTPQWAGINLSLKGFGGVFNQDASCQSYLSDSYEHRVHALVCQIFQAMR